MTRTNFLMTALAATMLFIALIVNFTPFPWQIDVLLGVIVGLFITFLIHRYQHLVFERTPDDDQEKVVIGTLDMGKRKRKRPTRATSTTGTKGDVVDEGNGKPDFNPLRNVSEKYLRRFLSEFLPGEDKIVMAWRDTRFRLGIPLLLLAVSALSFYYSEQIKTARISLSGAGLPTNIFPEIPRATPTPTPGKSGSSRENRSPAERRRAQRRRERAAERRQAERRRERIEARRMQAKARRAISRILKVIGVLALLGMGFAILWWRSTVTMITNLQYIRARKFPAWLPFLPEKFDRESLSIMRDANPVDTLTGRIFGLGTWGSVDVEMDRHVLHDEEHHKKAKNRPTHVFLKGVPNHRIATRALILSAREVGGGGSIVERIAEERYQQH